MIKRIGLLLIVALSLSGCADVQLKPDEMYTITLPANPTAGYQWRIRNNKVPPCLKFLRKDYKSDEATDNVVGFGGQAVFMFQAVEKGKGQLTFDYIRTWEPTKKPLQEKTYRVEVK